MSGVGTVLGAIGAALLLGVGSHWLRSPDKLLRMGAAMGHSGWYGRFVARTLPLGLVVFGLIGLVLTGAALVAALDG